MLFIKSQEVHIFLEARTHVGELDLVNLCVQYLLKNTEIVTCSCPYSEKVLNAAHVQKPRKTKAH